LPKDHLYFSLVKAKLLPAGEREQFEQLINQALPKVKQQIRRDYILEKLTNA